MGSLLSPLYRGNTLSLSLTVVRIFNCIQNDVTSQWRSLNVVLKNPTLYTVCICRLILFTISFVKLLILHLCCFLMFFSNAENAPLFLLLKQLIVFLFLPSYLFSSSLPPILNTVEIRIQDKSGFELWLSNVLDFEWLGGVIAIRMQASLDHLTNKPFQNRTKKLNRGGLLLVSTGLPFCGMVFVKVK